jgi:hypothetical protein
MSEQENTGRMRTMVCWSGPRALVAPRSPRHVGENLVVLLHASQYSSDAALVVFILSFYALYPNLERCLTNRHYLALVAPVML